jgi:hypothetical protein
VTCSVATLLGQICIVARDFETRRHTAAVSGRSGMGKRCGPWSAYSKHETTKTLTETLGKCVRLRAAFDGPSTALGRAGIDRDAAACLRRI